MLDGFQERWQLKNREVTSFLLICNSRREMKSRLALRGGKTAYSLGLYNTFRGRLRKVIENRRAASKYLVLLVRIVIQTNLMGYLIRSVENVYGKAELV